MSNSLTGSLTLRADGLEVRYVGVTDSGMYRYQLKDTDSMRGGVEVFVEVTAEGMGPWTDEWLRELDSTTRDRCPWCFATRDEGRDPSLPACFSDWHRLFAGVAPFTEDER